MTSRVPDRAYQNTKLSRTSGSPPSSIPHCRSHSPSSIARTVTFWETILPVVIGPQASPIKMSKPRSVSNDYSIALAAYPAAPYPSGTRPGRLKPVCIPKSTTRFGQALSFFRRCQAQCHLRPDSRVWQRLAAPRSPRHPVTSAANAGAAHRFALCPTAPGGVAGRRCTRWRWGTSNTPAFGLLDRTRRLHYARFPCIGVGRRTS